MSDVVPPQIDPRDLTIAEQANRIAELTKLVAEVTQENKQFREENRQFREENKQLKKRIERLEALLATKLDAKSSKKPVFTENYSLERNKLLDPNKPGNKDSDKKPRKKSTGRKPREAKEHLVSDTIAVFPEGVDRDKCIHHRFQSAWRIVDGKAVYLVRVCKMALRREFGLRQHPTPDEDSSVGGIIWIPDHFGGRFYKIFPASARAFLSATTAFSVWDYSRPPQAAWRLVRAASLCGACSAISRRPSVCRLRPGIANDT